jgi:broad-specificity NMP kinase
MNSNKQPNPLLIEFFGMPGIGKSTLAQNIIPRIQNMGYVCPPFNEIISLKKKYPLNIVTMWFATKYKINNKNKLIDLILLLCRYPTFSAKAFLLNLHLSGLNTDSMRICRRFLKWYRFYHHQSVLNQSQLAIFDDALIQTLMSIVWEGKKFIKKPIKKVLCQILQELHTIFISVEANPQLISQRLKMRSNLSRSIDSNAYIWRFADQSVEEQKKKIIAGCQIFECLSEMIHDIRPKSVLIIKGENSIQDNIPLITDFILKRLNEAKKRQLE